MGNVPAKITGKYQSYDINTPSYATPPMTLKKQQNYDHDANKRSDDNSSNQNINESRSMEANIQVNNSNKNNLMSQIDIHSENYEQNIDRLDEVANLNLNDQSDESISKEMSKTVNQHSFDSDPNSEINNENENEIGNTSIQSNI